MMKPILFLAIALIAGSLCVSAQNGLEKTVKRTGKKVESKVENRINKHIDKGIDKALDEVEESVTGSGKEVGNKKVKSQPDSKGSTSQTETGRSKNEASQEGNNTQQEASQQDKPELVWSKYDFIPGSEIIFEDNQEGEKNGEFPSKWDLVAGVIENAVFDQSNVIYFREIGNGGGITPLVKENKADYLPDEFTIEFDCYFDKDIFNQRYYLSFFAVKKQKPVLSRVTLTANQAQYGTSDTKGLYPGADRSNIDKIARWRHIAISFNKRALKVYMDDARLLNIPNIEENPTGFTVGTTSQKGINYFIRNVRIAKGAVPLYDKVLTDGRFITTGIKFDVSKASIKPESMGTINFVVKMMQDHPELKFSVEGHTDSDGDDASNLKLSEARSHAVVQKLREQGIAAERLASKGWGESRPMTANDSPEGKAQNRRVEFVKF